MTEVARGEGVGPAGQARKRLADVPHQRPHGGRSRNDRDRQKHGGDGVEDIHPSRGGLMERAHLVRLLRDRLANHASEIPVDGLVMHSGQPLREILDRGAALFQRQDRVVLVDQSVEQSLDLRE